MIDADSIETTDVRGSCSWCEGSLRPHHFVQAVRSSVFVLCSEECLRAKLQRDATTRSQTRRRAFKVFVVGMSVVAACITPHDGPRSLRKAVVVQAAAPAGTAPLPGALGPEGPPT